MHFGTEGFRYIILVAKVLVKLCYSNLNTYVLLSKEEETIFL